MAVKECCENVFMSFTRWLFESRKNFLFDSWNYDKLRVNLLGKGEKLVAETYNTHLIEAFRTYKHRSTFRRTCEKLSFTCRIRIKRKCTINISALQAELTRHFRGPVILEIIKDDSPRKDVSFAPTTEVDYSRLSPFDGPMGTEEGDA